MVARLGQGHVASDRLDDAGALVAEDDRQRIGKLALDHLEVGVAKAARLVAHQHVVRLQFRDGDLADDHRLVHPLEDGGIELHVVPPQLARIAGASRSRTFSAPA